MILDVRACIHYPASRHERDRLTERRSRGGPKDPPRRPPTSRLLTSPLTVLRELRRWRLAWRSAPTRSHRGSQGFKSPHLHPRTLQVRAPPASLGRRLAFVWDHFWSSARSHDHRPASGADTELPVLAYTGRSNWMPMLSLSLTTIAVGSVVDQPSGSKKYLPSECVRNRKPVYLYL
jgi:hypothetical protein